MGRRDEGGLINYITRLHLMKVIIRLDYNWALLNLSFIWYVVVYA